MALSTVIFVGKAKEWLPEIVERAKKLKVNEGQCVCVSSEGQCVCVCVSSE